MQILPFEAFYHTDFSVSEAFAKYQDWYHRENVYSSLRQPKPSHTFLWFKNCRGHITDSEGRELDVPRGALTYMAKGIRYRVDFIDTSPDRPDTLVVHFQLSVGSGEEAAPTLIPEICLPAVDASLGMALEMLAEEYKLGTVCVPETNGVICRIFAAVCKARRREAAAYRFACIKPGIDLLEMGSAASVGELAAQCGVSECYFRRLFREYSGMSPTEFRRKNRIDRAKRLLLSENLTTEELSQELGFCDVYHFSRTFKLVTGVTPREFLHGTKNAERSAARTAEREINGKETES